MFILAQTLESHYARSNRLTIILGTSTQVLSATHEIIDRFDKAIDDFPLNQVITEEKITGKYYGQHLCACEDGIFIFSNNGTQATFLHPDAKTLIDTSNSSFGESKESQQESLDIALAELAQPHEFATVFEYDMHPAYLTDVHQTRLNLLNANLADTTGKNVYLKRRQTGHLFPPARAKGSIFLTRDEHYLVLEGNAAGRASFVKDIPSHKPTDARDHFAR